MIITTIDPVTGNKISNLEQRPFITEGSGVAETKIYFENDLTLREYLETSPECINRVFYTQTGT